MMGCYAAVGGRDYENWDRILDGAPLVNGDPFLSGDTGRGQD